MRDLNCPLILANRPDTNNFYCLKYMCAWWQSFGEDLGECCILTIAEELKNIESVMKASI